MDTDSDLNEPETAPKIDTQRAQSVAKAFPAGFDRREWFGPWHRHRFDTIDTVEIETEDPTGTRYVLRCVGCGEIRQRDVI